MWLPLARPHSSSCAARSVGAPCPRFCILLSAFCFAVAGCAPRSELTLESFRDPAFPEHTTVHFGECYYRVGADNDYYIVASGAGADPGGDAGEHLLEIRTTWRPRPERTFSNPTTVDALVNYVIRRSGQTRTYRGTAFVYLRGKPGDSTLRCAVESGTIRPLSPQQHTRPQAGDTHDSDDPLGETRLTGKLRPSLNPARAVDLSALIARSR
ncbi:MAG: hypothetical protein CHACPFDD_03063 [Phycisphaerae bacterium]|nr:hypothetical protein [Phycisphaerae bacterium]